MGIPPFHEEGFKKKNYFCHVYLEELYKMLISYSCFYKLFSKYGLTPKELEMHVCVLSIVATDALVVKHQAISIHNADRIFTVLDQFQTKISNS